MSQYFENDDALRSDPAEVLSWCGARELRFTTDAGVFSRGEVDDASLLLVQRLPPLAGRVLDLGCGYGFIGIWLAAKDPGIALTQSDVNRRALALCSENCRRNGIVSEVVESDGFEKLPGLFDAVVLNPPIHAGKEVCFRLYEQASAHLAAGGRLYLVIRKKHGAESTKKRLTELGFRVEELAREKGVFVFACARE